ncbi:MAG: sel1 repeat family protein [Magnetococcales bacterium]|nr:sel1 repeat family protein [Magnetococcales bacterium]
MWQKRTIVWMVFGCFFVIFMPQGHGMTGLEFMELQAHNQHNLIEPLIREYLEAGYKNIPNWAEISYEMEDLIRKKGYSGNEVREIAFEAAIRRGMHKKKQQVVVQELQEQRPPPDPNEFDNQLLRKIAVAPDEAQRLRGSAEEGDVKSQIVLGKMYAQGVGVAKNLVDAYMWFSIAAKQESLRGAGYRDIMAKYLTRQQIERAETSANEWVAMMQKIQGK